MRQARAAAGGKDVTVVGGPDLGRQLLLGGGLRLFDDLGGEPIDLERVGVFESGQRTTIRFRVVRSA